eukprot:SAG11_NODE_10830_length_803_cov_0.940341_1_plen_96_part_00
MLESNDIHVFKIRRVFVCMSVRAHVCALLLLQDTFRNMAPYIVCHRGSICVIHVPGEAIGGHCANFSILMQDIILLSALGVKIVLVAGCRPQVSD